MFFSFCLKLLTILMASASVNAQRGARGMNSSALVFLLHHFFLNFSKFSLMNFFFIVEFFGNLWIFAKDES